MTGCNNGHVIGGCVSDIVLTVFVVVVRGRVRGQLTKYQSDAKRRLEHDFKQGGQRNYVQVRSRDSSKKYNDYQTSIAPAPRVFCDVHVLLLQHVVRHC